jgi:hypothetical protein
LPTKASEEIPLSWLYSLTATSQKQGVIPHAAAAIGYGWIGHSENRLDLVRNSLGLYTNVLRQLRQLIERDRSSYFVELIPSMQLLFLYEVSFT